MVHGIYVQASIFPINGHEQCKIKQFINNILHLAASPTRQS